MNSYGHGRRGNEGVNTIITMVATLLQWSVHFSLVMVWLQRGAGYSLNPLEGARLYFFSVFLGRSTA